MKEEPNFNHSERYKVYNLFNAIAEIVETSEGESISWSTQEDILRKHKCQHLSKAQVMAFVSGATEVTLQNVSSLYLELSLLRKCQRWGVKPWKRQESVMPEYSEESAIAFLKSKVYTKFYVKRQAMKKFRKSPTIEYQKRYL